MWPGKQGALKALGQGSGAELDTACARYAGAEDLGSYGTFGERKPQVGMTVVESSYALPVGHSLGSEGDHTKWVVVTGRQKLLSDRMWPPRMPYVHP